MGNRLKIKPTGLILLGAALCFIGSAYAQDTSNTTTTPSAKATKPSGGEDEYPDLVEIDPFGGVSIYGDVLRGLDTHTADGGVAGIRVAVNPYKYLGLELFFDYANANVEFREPSATGLPTYSFGSRNYAFGLNPIIDLRPRGSRVQPYLTVGVGGTQFTPTSTAKSLARNSTNNATYFSGNLNDNLQVVLNYGGGVKFHLSDHFGLRFDARGFWSRNPTYDLPNYPDGGIYIPAHDKLNGLQATLGLVFYLGQEKCPEPPVVTPRPPLNAGSITGGEGPICAGKPVTLHSTASGPSGDTLAYAWTVNGQATGSNSPDLQFTPSGAGPFNIQVTVTDTTPSPAVPTPPKWNVKRCGPLPSPAPVPAPVTATANLVLASGPPAITSVTASPDTVFCAANKTGTHSATLTVAATPSACGGALTYKWTVTEGSVSNDTSANATFDSSTVNFEGAQSQSKSITATVTVTDETGQSATGTANVTVNCPPQFVRLDDVVFAKNNARVNNCGKRILIDEAAPQATSGGYDIILVAHRDTDEEANVPGKGRGKRRAAGLPLDEQRALNAAGVLSGGGATCAKFDSSHIQIDWVGTDQTSETRPGLCGTSNLPAQKERRGSQTSADDKNRRVEVYLVPHGSTTLPPAAKAPKPVPDRELKAVGCPR